MSALATIEAVRCEECGVLFEPNGHGRPRRKCERCAPPKGQARPELEVVSGLRLAGDPFTLEHFKAWAAALTLDSGDGWVLEPFQEAFVADWLDGFNECWLIVPEGNGKTTLMAAIGLYHCQFTHRAAVSLAASSREQAEIAYLQAEGLVEGSDSLKGVFRCYEGYRRIVCPAQSSRMQVKAADDRTGDGIIPTLCLVDELHRHRDLKLYRTWRGKLRKRRGQIVTISTAGEPGGEFEETRERIRQTSPNVSRDGAFLRAATDRLVLHEWAVAEDADVEDLDVVKAANPLTHVTVELLREAFDSPTMTLPHWRRFVCNLPTRVDAAAVTEGEWAAMRSEEHDEIPEGVPIDAGLDLAFKWDTTALVPLWWRDDEYRLLGAAKILEPPRNGESLDSHLIERALIELNERNPIERLVVDRSKAEQLCQWASETLGCVVVERAQTNAFAVSDYELWVEAMSRGWLKHTGDPGLTRHVLNASSKLLPGGDTRFDRPTQSRGVAELQPRRVIDALTAASQVHSEAALAHRSDSLPQWEAV